MKLQVFMHSSLTETSFFDQIHDIEPGSISSICYREGHGWGRVIKPEDWVKLTFVTTSLIGYTTELSSHHSSLESVHRPYGDFPFWELIWNPLWQLACTPSFLPICKSLVMPLRKGEGKGVYGKKEVHFYFYFYTVLSIVLKLGCSTEETSCTCAVKVYRCANIYMCK